MNPTYDNSKVGLFSGNSSSDTITVGNNPNRVLVICQTVLTSSRSCAVTANGSGVTGTTIDFIHTIYSQRLQIFYVVNPPVGTNTINFQVDSSNNATVSYAFFSVYNVNQAAPDNSAVYGNTNVNDQSGSVSVTPTVNNCLFIGFGVKSVHETVTGIANHQTIASGIVIGDAGLVSTNTSWSLASTQGDQFLMSAITLAPVPIVANAAILYEVV